MSFYQNMYVGNLKLYIKKGLLKESFDFFIYGESVSRVLSFKTVIYLNRISLYGSSHLLERCRANLAFLSGVAPDGVYSALPSPECG